MASSSLDQQLQQYIELDNRSKALYQELLGIRETKARVQSSLTKYVEEKGLLQKPLSFRGETIQFVTARVAPTLSFKYVESCLGEIITNEEQLEKIMDYLKQKRVIRTTTEIRRQGRDEVAKRTGEK